MIGAPAKRKSHLNTERMLLIKGHSAGIGDLLRSSAAWRTLKERFPGARLFLLFLTGEPGYPSESLIARHHLLDGFFAVKKRPKTIQEWRAFEKKLTEIMETVMPTLVIDFEPHGLRTSLVALWMRLKYGVGTVGINEVPPRGIFYGLSSVSSKKFATQRGLDFPLEYTNRDFVALSVLDIDRGATPIELEETAEGKEFRTGFRERLGIPLDAPILGVHIGCGTPDNLHKRPDLGLLSSVVGHLQEKYGFAAVITGAGFESDINARFMELHGSRFPFPVHDLAGKTNLSELTGLIGECSFFVSTDSGPYHMAVAMKVPTLAIFTIENRVHYHHESWVRCVMLETEEDVIPAISMAEEIVGSRQPVKAA